MKRFNEFQIYTSLIISCLITSWIMSGEIMDGHVTKTCLTVCTLIISILVLTYLGISAIKTMMTSIIKNAAAEYIIDGLLVLGIVTLKICGEFFPEANILLLMTMTLICLMIVALYHSARMHTNSELRTLLYYRLMFVVYLSIVPAAQNYIGPEAFMPPALNIIDIILSIMFNLFFAYIFYMLSWFILRHIIKPVWRYASAIYDLKDIPYPLC